MIVDFLNGTDQQRAWFREAYENAWATWSGEAENFSGAYSALAWSDLKVQTTVEWKVDPGPAGNSEAGYTSVWHDGVGWRAAIELHRELDDPTSQANGGLGKPFYTECVIHELAHVVMGANLNEQRIARLCELFGGARNEWDDEPIVWTDRIEEGVAELLKDALAQPSLRHFTREQRNHRALQLSGATGSDGHWILNQPVEWLELVQMFQDGAGFAPTYVPFAQAVDVPWVEDIPGSSGLMRHVHRIRLTGVPYYGANPYFGRARLLGDDGQDYEPQVFNFRATGTVYDALGNAIAPVSYFGGGDPLTWVEWAAPVALGEFDAERAPLEIELEVRYTAGTAFGLADVVTDARVNGAPGTVFFVPPPYPTLRALVPSSIVAYPHVPGTRRTPRMVVGGTR